MARHFRPVDRDQPFLLPPDMREWLPAGHLAWFMIDAAEALDVSRFAVRVTPRGSAAGRAAYDPRMLLALLAYGYARGVRSSRRIERACTEDVAFRVICAQDVPDHATIARFRRSHFADPAGMQDLFAQVLVLAARAGLGNLGEIAVDGTKMAANASREATRGEARLRELAGQILAEAEAADAAEDALFGEAAGDELPAELADPVTRGQRIRAALADIDAEREAARGARDARAREYLDASAAGRPKAGNPPAEAAAELARAKAARKRAGQQAKAGAWEARDAAARAAGRRGLPGTRPVPPDEHHQVRKAEAEAAAAEQRAAAKAAKAAGAAEAAGGGPARNITDPDSRLMPVRGGGFLQGYNAQAVRSRDGLCVAARVTADTTDYASFEPLLRQAQAAQDLLRAHARGPLHRLRARIGVVLADAGYCSGHNLTCPGPDRLIATGKRRDLEDTARHGPAPGCPQPASPPIAAMAARLARPAGLAAYRRRSAIIETAFGDAKHNRGFRQLSLRGLPRADGEWKFHHTAANLLKIHQATRPATR